MNKVTKRQIVKRSEKEKLELISQWEKSGLSIKKFCHQHHFSDSLFHNWLNKYRRHNIKAPASHNDFMALPISAPAAIAEDRSLLYAEVALASGSRIKLYQPV